MTVTEGVCAFAWRHYLLVHSSISEDDSRRSALSRYLTDLRNKSEYDFDLLQIAAVSYLKRLDKCKTIKLRDTPQMTLWPTACNHAVRNPFTHKGANSMADKIAIANHSARHPQRITAATGSGIDAMKPMMLFQVSMLRL